METIISEKDYWGELVIRHKDDIVQFLKNGSFNDNPLFKRLFKYLGSQEDDRLELQYKTEDNKNDEFSDVDICNAVYELKHMALSNIELDIMPAIECLCEARATAPAARDILMNTENCFRKILSSHFRLYTDCFPKEPKFIQCQERLDWLLAPYAADPSANTVLYPPIDIVRRCRNKVHSKRENSNKSSSEKDAILFKDQKLPDDEVLALEIVKFIVFSYVGVVVVARKFLAKCQVQKPETECFIENFATEKRLTKYIEAYRNSDAERKDSLRTEYKSKVIEWTAQLVKNAATILTRHDPHIKVCLDIYSESDITSLKWRIGKGKWNIETRAKIEIRMFRYQEIQIKVKSIDKEITFIQTITSRHRGNNFTFKLDCDNKMCKVICNSIKENNYRATIKVSADLDCSLEIYTYKIDVKRREVTEVTVPKGKHSIILAAKSNPSYKIAETIEVTDDASYEYNFTDLVSKHREWWKIKDIIILKRSRGHSSYAVLWDKTVGMAVREYEPLQDIENYPQFGAIDHCKLGIIGNFFYYRYEKEDYCEDYRLYNLDNHDVSKETFKSSQLLTFDKSKHFYFITNMDGVKIIDKNGHTLYDVCVWDEEKKRHLTEVVKKWIAKFHFSEGRAAMLGDDGITLHFVTEKWKKIGESYSYTGNYPVFRNGYCAVKKGDEGYLFLENLKFDLKERSERYDYLEPVEINGRWVYKAEKDGCTEFIDPTQQDENGLPSKLDGIAPQPETPKVIRREEISEHFCVVSTEADGAVCKSLRAEERIIAENISQYKTLTSTFTAVRYSDDRWYVYDVDGTCRFEALEQFRIHKNGYFQFNKDGYCEVWKAEDTSLNKICRDEKTFSPYGNSIWNEKTLINLTDGKILTLYSGQWMWEENEYIGSLIAPNIDVINMEHFLIPFSISGSSEVVGLMKRDTHEEVIAPAYQSIERAGNVWIASHDGLKTIFSDKGETLAENLDYDSIEEHEGTCLYIAEKDGEKCLIDKNGAQKSNIYKAIRPKKHGFAAVLGYGWGFIRIEDDKIEEICRSYYYHDVKDFTEEGYAQVQKEEEGDWGLIDRDGNLVIDCRYTEIIPVKDGLFNARKRYKWTILNKEGQEVR